MKINHSRIILTVLIGLTIFSCNQTAGKKTQDKSDSSTVLTTKDTSSVSKMNKVQKKFEGVEIKAEFYIKDHLMQFEHKNILIFPKDSINDLNFDRPIFEIHIPIIKDLHFQVFQNPNEIDSILCYTTKVLYSIQNATGHQGILIAGMDNGWVDNIYYRSYDNKGKFLAETVLYRKGGDGGYHSHSFGKFINDTTYIRHTIECEAIDAKKGVEKCDSSSQIIYIHHNGTIEVDNGQ